MADRDELEREEMMMRTKMEKQGRVSGLLGLEAEIEARENES